MSKVIIMRGISGSGKSTAATKIIQEAECFSTICSADNYWIDSEGGYNFNPSLLGEAHNQCFKEFTKALSEETPLIVVDNTNTTVKEIERYVLRAKSYNADIEIIRCVCPHKTAAERNIHNVPAKTIKRMFSRMADLPKDWPKETIIVTG